MQRSSSSIPPCSSWTCCWRWLSTISVKTRIPSLGFTTSTPPSWDGGYGGCLATTTWTTKRSNTTSATTTTTTTTMDDANGAVVRSSERKGIISIDFKLLISYWSWLPLETTETGSQWKLARFLMSGRELNPDSWDWMPHEGTVGYKHMS